MFQHRIKEKRKALTRRMLPQVLNDRTSYAAAASILRNDPRFKALTSESERKSLVEARVEALRAARTQKREEEEKKQGLLFSCFVIQLDIWRCWLTMFCFLCGRCPNCLCAKQVCDWKFALGSIQSLGRRTATWSGHGTSAPFFSALVQVEINVIFW